MKVKDIMNKHNISGMPVVEGEKVAGILRTPEYSKGDGPVTKVMSRCLYAISPEEGIEKAAEMMTKHRINRLPVVEDDKLVGIITRGDIIAGLGGRR